MYDRVLIPTDGSPAVDEALRHALDLASTYGSEIHVLYVVDTSSVPVDSRGQMLVDALEAEGRRSVGAVVDRAADAGIESVVTAVVDGVPYREILRYVDEHAVDLVVMATRGRRGIDRYLLGSVTRRVVRLSDVPVLTVRAAESGST